MQCSMFIIDVPCFIWWESATIISFVVFQNYLACVEGETGSRSETCVTCAVDETEEVSIKVEEELDIKSEIPEAIASSSIKTEHEVRLRGLWEVVAAHAS